MFDELNYDTCEKVGYITRATFEVPTQERKPQVSTYFTSTNWQGLPSWVQKSGKGKNARLHNSYRV